MANSTPGLRRRPQRGGLPKTSPRTIPAGPLLGLVAAYGSRARLRSSAFMAWCRRRDDDQEMYSTLRSADGASRDRRTSARPVVRALAVVAIMVILSTESAPPARFVDPPCGGSGARRWQKVGRPGASRPAPICCAHRGDRLRALPKNGLMAETGRSSSVGSAGHGLDWPSADSRSSHWCSLSRAPPSERSNRRS